MTEGDSDLLPYVVSEEERRWRRKRRTTMDLAWRCRCSRGKRSEIGRRRRELTGARRPGECKVGSKGESAAG